MTVQEFYDFVRKHDKLDAEMWILTNPDNPFSKGGIHVNQYMIDIRCKRDKETGEKRFTVEIG